MASMGRIYNTCSALLDLQYCFRPLYRSFRYDTPRTEYFIRSKCLRDSCKWYRIRQTLFCTAK
ncbi:hypothetical protein BGZ60DRAFT_415102 [Tricladium varicosporioides]|nr:hypothetical protein BGZ60DRAFT_415102 [Hymenoscyphus varicosporioides]